MEAQWAGRRVADGGNGEGHRPARVGREALGLLLYHCRNKHRELRLGTRRRPGEVISHHSVTSGLCGLHIRQHESLICRSENGIAFEEPLEKDRGRATGGRGERQVMIGNDGPALRLAGQKRRLARRIRRETRVSKLLVLFKSSWTRLGRRLRLLWWQL